MADPLEAQVPIAKPSATQARGTPYDMEMFESNMKQNLQDNNLKLRLENDQLMRELNELGGRFDSIHKQQQEFTS